MKTNQSLRKIEGESEDTRRCSTPLCLIRAKDETSILRSLGLHIVATCVYILLNFIFLMCICFSLLEHNCCVFRFVVTWAERILNLFGGTCLDLFFVVSCL
ncbi:unnamed protein product [Brassica oleracea]